VAACAINLRARVQLPAPRRDRPWRLDGLVDELLELLDPGQDRHVDVLVSDIDDQSCKPRETALKTARETALKTA